MRALSEYGTLNILSPEVFSVLQLHAINEPLLPNLQTLDLGITTEESIPFIPFLLSPRTTTIDIIFLRSALSTAIVASMITTFPTQGPNLQNICLKFLPRDPVITVAFSKILLESNRNALRGFRVRSSLTEEAREAVCKLPDLSVLWMAIEGSTSLPTLVLPGLTEIEIEYGHDRNWLQGFYGATLGRLTSVTFRSESGSIGNFLEAFKRVALTTSIPATLLTFRFHTSRSWRPKYHSLLPFYTAKKTCHRLLV